MKKLIIFSMIALIFTVSSITINASVDNYDNKINYIYRQSGNEGPVLVAQSNMTSGAVFSYNFDFSFTSHYNQTSKDTNYTSLFNDFTGITIGIANATSGNLWSNSSYDAHLYIWFDYTESQRRLDISYIAYSYVNGVFTTFQNMQQDSVFLNYSQNGLYDSPPFFSISLNTNSDVTNNSRVRVNIGRYFIDLTGSNANNFATSLDFLDITAGANHNIYVATSDYDISYALDANKFVNGAMNLYIGNHYGDVVTYHSNIYSYYYNRSQYIFTQQDLVSLPENFVTGLNSLLGLNFGGVTLGALVLIPITIGIFSWFIKISRK
jgi:hypothetical protein